MELDRADSQFLQYQKNVAEYGTENNTNIYSTGTEKEDEKLRLQEIAEREGKNAEQQDISLQKFMLQMKNNNNQDRMEEKEEDQMSPQEEYLNELRKLQK
jgi:hypothetical protein